MKKAYLANGLMLIVSVLVVACNAGSPSLLPQPLNANSSLRLPSGLEDAQKSPVDTITVPLSYTVDGNSMGLHMSLNLGNNKLNVAVDTGSVGLRVIEKNLHDWSQINKTTTKVDYGYADGVHISGVLASGPMNIGGVTSLVNFMLIESIDCYKNQPNCPAATFSSDGRAGLLGVDLNISASDANIWNPLAELPGNLGKGFYISGSTANNNSPHMVIGLTSANSQNFNYLELNPMSVTGVNPPYPTWDTTLNGSYSYQNYAPVSGKILFDTGTSYSIFYSGLFPEKFPAGVVNLAAGTAISFAVSDSAGNNFNWNLISGNTPYFNAAYATSEPSQLVVNTGNAPFTKYDILYNIESGLIGFR